MKKILAAAFLFCFTGGVVMAQPSLQKAGAVKHETTTTVKQKTKAADATTQKTAATAEKTKVHADATAGKNKEQLKSTVKPAKKTKTAVAGTGPLKKDGTPDKRFKDNKKLKKDGTPDKRFKENQHH